MLSIKKMYRLQCVGHVVPVLSAFALQIYPKYNGSYHYNDAMMGAMASQITNLIIIYATVYSGEEKRIHQSSESLTFLRGIHRWPVNSPHKWPVTRKMLPFDDVIMYENSTAVRSLLWLHSRSDVLRLLLLYCTQHPAIMGMYYDICVWRFWKLYNVKWEFWSFSSW